MAELRLPNLNKVFIAGRLTRDPELRYTPSGTPVANFAVATNRRYKDQSGEWREETHFFDVVAWQRLAETCRDTLHKGSAVVVEGRLQTRSWETEQGQRRKAFEINAQRLDVLDRVRREGGAPEAAAPESGAPEEEFVGGSEAVAERESEDVPF